IAARDGDVVFQGNTAGANDDANSVFVADNGMLSVGAEEGRTIWFYDPIDGGRTDENLALLINESGRGFSGTVVFDQHTSNFDGHVRVEGGTMVLQNGASIGMDGPDGNNDDFTILPGATLVVAYEQPTRTFTPVYDDEGNLLRVDSDTTTPAFDPDHTSYIYADTATFDGANLRFVLPRAKVDLSTPLLTVSEDPDVDGPVTFTGAKVRIVLPTDAPIYQKGDAILLVKGDDGGIADRPHDHIGTARAKQGSMLAYDFHLHTFENDLVAVLPDEPTTSEEAPLVSQANLGAVAALMSGLDMAAGDGMAAMASKIRHGRGRNVFGLVSGTSSRYKTGSHVDIEGVTGMVGATGDWEYAAGDLMAAGFFTSGTAHYAAVRNAYGQRVTARGDTSYTGAGLMGRFEFRGDGNGYPYLDASLQGGESRMNFHSRDLRDEITGMEARFKSKAPYYAAHLGGGYVWKLADAGKVETYLTYLAVRRDAEQLRLNTGERLHFAAVTSQRLRLGARRMWLVNNRWQPFVGLAAEEEFSGRARASAQGLRIDEPEIRGANGVAEIGLRVVDAQDEALTIDLALHGYVGRRRGVAGMFRGEYKF
ncbi:MAG: autotransporter outer membrane beta-barrel domain-containing protein, partial [Azoarcus sp.]|nr:autotransporter outer membrane beta-barrel domain-containing protein [Azoarcus sp.]